ncbi:MAG: tRNA guanosine(34) transglycosylase Tgt [bacterium]|nr:tRNA guanosine(34) transglycosylase Tgt [bacterium]
MRFDLESGAGDGPRLGRLATARGEVATPVFMPVGTRASVKTLTPGEVRALGARIILVNAYHLYLRPGRDVIREAGGVHSFMAWEGPVLSDSGGFQVFSLSRLCSVGQSGVTFRSHLDGSEHFLSPEDVMRIQADLGTDIAMPLDVCVPYPCGRAESARAVELTAEWARRSLAAARPEQTLFGIVQGGACPDLRREAARGLVDLGFPGYALGGLSVGEPKSLLYSLLEETVAHLPADRPRYLMGVGAPDDLVQAVARGIDMFDSVFPTRLARHGTVLTRDGPLRLRAARFRRDRGPIDENCRCYTCRTFSRAYLQHLLAAGELLGMRLTTLHNLHFTLELVEEMRGAIAGGRFASWRISTLERYQEGKAARTEE